MIELDIQLSRDRELVVMHDLALERTTNGTGLVRERNFSDLKRLDCGSWFGSAFAGETVLSLGEVIALLPDRVRLNVEIKALEDDWEEISARLVELLRASGRLGNTIVSSFLFDALEQLRRHDADLPIGLLTHDPNLWGVWDWAERIAATSLHPYFAFVDEALIKAAHQRGMKVIVWTVNDMDAARRLVDLGVDGIITDFPEALDGLVRDDTIE